MARAQAVPKDCCTPVASPSLPQHSILVSPRVRIGSNGRHERLCSRCDTWKEDIEKNFYRKDHKLRSPCRPCAKEKRAVDYTVAVAVKRHVALLIEPPGAVGELLKAMRNWPQVVTE